MPSPTAEILRAIADLAAPQHGVVSVAQMSSIGITRSQVDNLARRAVLVRVAAGVYRVLGAPESVRLCLHAGLLALGPEAFVSHGSAAQVHRLDRADPASVELSVPRRRKNASGPFVVHSTGHLGRVDVVIVDGLRVSSATRTIIDLARARIAPVRLEAMIDSAVRLGLSSPVVLTERLSQLRGPGRWGCRLLDELVVDSGGHTLLERRFLQLVRRHGFPTPRTQVVHRVGQRTVARVDFLFDAHDLVVEVSGGRGHSSPAERARDAQRRNELQDLGRAVLEFTWEQVTQQEHHVAAQLARWIARPRP